MENAIHDKTFFTGGKATFTIAPSPQYLLDNKDCKPHYTYLITHKVSEHDLREDKFFVALLSGQDNNDERNYKYLGVMENGNVRLTAKSKIPEQSYPVKIVKRVLACYWRNEQDKIEQNGWMVQHAGKCCRCGRKLTTTTSISLGIGPECLKNAK